MRRISAVINAVERIYALMLVISIKKLDASYYMKNKENIYGN
ncbi:hypothetical protein [Clostridium septicum]|nr:hypothetical protein [Clostridium septicum]MDU1313907.1 hypothetical protein [Clostridium septicum]WLF70446.1 hypothetical protein Q6375_05520 [Clostridium septicum]